MSVEIFDCSDTIKNFETENEAMQDGEVKLFSLSYL